MASPQSSCDQLERVKSFLRVQRSHISHLRAIIYVKVMLHMHAAFTLAMSPECLEDSKCLQVHTVSSLVYNNYYMMDGER